MYWNKLKAVSILCNITIKSRNAPVRKLLTSIVAFFEGKTPADVSGIKIEGENKWI